jgi:hypothetical protein
LRLTVVHLTAAMSWVIGPCIFFCFQPADEL